MNIPCNLITIDKIKLTCFVLIGICFFFYFLGGLSLCLAESASLLTEENTEISEEDSLNYDNNEEAELENLSPTPPAKSPNISPTPVIKKTVVYEISYLDPTAISLVKINGKIIPL